MFQERTDEGSENHNIVTGRSETEPRKYVKKQKNKKKVYHRGKF